jgi:hypothetical protein
MSAGDAGERRRRAESGTAESDPEAVDGDPTAEDGDAGGEEAVAGGRARAESDGRPGSGTGDETVPRVEMGLYQLSVAVSGRSDDDLEAVEGAARRLMDYLVERSETLEERPADRGRG